MDEERSTQSPDSDKESHASFQRSDDGNSSDSSSNKSASDSSSKSSTPVQSDHESDSDDNRQSSPKNARRGNISDSEDSDSPLNKSDSDQEKKSTISDLSDTQEENRTKKSAKRNRIDSDSDSDDNAKSAKSPKNDDNLKVLNLFGELSDDEEDDNEREEIEEREELGEKDDLEEREEPDEREEMEGRAERAEREEREELEERNNFLEDEEEEAPLPERRIEVEISRIISNLGNGVHFVKLPNFLSIDTHPYDPLTYEDEIDEDEVHDDEGRARLKLKVENTIRWRNVVQDDGTTVKESNSRICKWPDGTMSLHLGDEIFDIQTQKLLPGENNHLYVRQGTGLQGQAVFRTKLTFRPFSTESFTHRKLTLSLADRSQKTQKICVLPNVGKDPEANRYEMIKKEESKLKASILKESKQKRVKDRFFGRGPNSSYLENDEDDDESISISKIKNQYKRGPTVTDIRSSGDESISDDGESDDDSDLDIFEKKKSTEKKKIVESDED